MMDPVLKDKRFAHVATDLRYRSIPRRERKVKIDQRFRTMFTDDIFKVKYTVDKRGRPQNYTTNENLKKYYELSSSSASEEEEEEEEEEQPSCVQNDGQKQQSPEDEGPSDISCKESLLTKTSENLSISDKVSSRVEVSSDSSDDENEDDSDDVNESKQKFAVDFARGEGNVETSSDSSSDSSSEEEEGLIHPWNELHTDAPETNELSNRLAICNMDWDRVNAADLFILLNSFTPPGGLLKSVKIYLSDYGRERLREEDLMGPKELTESPEDYENDDVSDEDTECDKYHMEKLRQYQLNKLKYYYAVVECDSVATANKIYEECDGLEYESSAATLDVRVVPPDVTFDEEPHSVATSDMDMSNYRPKYFITTALQQASVKLTWDETHPDRTTTLQRAFNDDKELNVDVRAYLASSSSGDENDETDIKRVGFKKKESETHSDDKLVSVSDESEDSDGISKYKALLQEIEEGETKKTKDDVHLEITWGTGLKAKTETAIQNKVLKTQLTPWEEYLLKKKEKKRQTRLEKKKIGTVTAEEPENPYSDDELPSDVDLKDPFFHENSLDDNQAEEKKKNPKENAKRKQRVKASKSSQKEFESTEEDIKRKAELELLLMDETNPKRHFNLKKLLKEKKKKKEKSSTEQDDFTINVKDPRFSAIFNSHVYNIDPSDPNFKRTKGMEAFIEEKQKRHNEQQSNVTKKPKLDCMNDHTVKVSHSATESAKVKALELSSLVKSVKSKSSLLKQKRK